MTACELMNVHAVVVDCFSDTDTCLFLSLQSIKDTTTGADIFSEVLNSFDKFSLDLSTLCGIATDGALSMSGTTIEFVGSLL